MEPSELLELAAAILESHDIAYFTTGSMASMRYGEPRFTNDVDIVIQLDASTAASLCASFPEDDFYISPDAVREAIAHRSQFNVIHPASGLKIDFMVADRSAFNHSRFERVRNITFDSGTEIRFASPEDVILRKLEYFREGGSDKHLRDIRGILTLCELPIDIEYIEVWADRLGVETEWRIARDQ